MTDFELCEESALTEDEPLECDGPDGEPLVVVLHQDQVYAVAAECPHQAAPMVDAEVIDGNITCCLHFWTWSLADGSPVEEAEEPLPMYPVYRRDGKVWLRRESE